MLRVVEAIEQMVLSRGMFPGFGGGGQTSVTEIDLTDTNSKLDTLIGHVDDVEAKQDSAQTELVAINGNTIAAGGSTAAESLIDGTTSVASALISGGSTVIGAVFSGGLSLAGAVVLAGASVFVAGGITLASLATSANGLLQLMVSDIDEMRQIQVDEKGHWHYAANWNQTNFLGAARFDFEFNEEFRLNTIWLKRIVGSATPTLKIYFRDKEEGNNWELFESDAAALEFVHHYADLDRIFPKQFQLRIDLGNLLQNDEWLVGITGRNWGTTLPSITQWGTALQETIFRNHIHL